MSDLCRRIADHPWFQRAVIAAIVANAVLLGLETSRSLMTAHAGLFRAVNWAFQAFFVAELAVRLAAFGRRPWAFFRDGWNVFDFVVVAASLLPLNGAFANVGRLLRLLRVARLVSVSPQLRLIVATMLASIPSMGHVVLLLAVLLYMYGVAGVYLFRDAAPGYFGTLGVALLSLFQVVTLEGWADIQAAVIGPHPWAWAYFASFILVAVFVVINLFIAVVIDNLSVAKARLVAGQAPGPAAERPGGPPELADAVARLRAEVDRVESLLRAARPAAAPPPAAPADRIGPDATNRPTDPPDSARTERATR